MDKQTGGPLEYKLMQLLDLFLNDFKNSNETSLNNLLLHLSSSSELLASNLLTKWVIRAVTHWENTFIPNLQVRSFFVNCVAILSENVDNFRMFQKNNLYCRTLILFNMCKPDVAFTLKLAHIKLLKAFLLHEEGIQWIIATPCWNHLLNANFMTATVYVNREYCEAIYASLKKICVTDEVCCINIISKILNPLNITNNCSQALNTPRLPEIREVAFYESVKPSLSLINFMIKDVLYHPDNNGELLMKYLLQHFDLKKYMLSYFMSVYEEGLMFDIGNILIQIEFYDVYIKLKSREYSNIWFQNILNVFSKNIEQNHIENVLKHCHTSVMYWDITHKSLLEDVINSYELQNKEDFNISSKLLSIQILPVFVELFKDSTTNLPKTLLGNETPQLCLCRILNISSENFLPFLDLWYSCLLSSSKTQHSLRTLSWIISTKNCRVNDTPDTVFHCLMYLMQKIIDNLNKSSKVQKNVHLITEHILEGIITLIKDCELSNKNEEILNLVELSVRILSFPSASLQALYLPFQLKFLLPVLLSDIK